MIGRELDSRYRILSKLGEGGWAEVYLVEHIALGRKEALKVLLPDLGATPKLISRFRREARATNRLQHPNIICVYDFGQLPDGRFYLTTEYADGEGLDAAISRVFRFPIPAALALLAQLAEAVDHAHSRGVIHRDLKPANMILVRRHANSYLLKVLDFGIAKIIAPDYQDSLVKTTRGEIFGTPAYMAPEQIRGEAVDPRVDIYAVGCIAYELLVGTPPFWGRSVEIMNAHMCEQPARPSERRPEAAIPPALDRIVLRCMAKEPDRRFQTGRELRAALKDVPGYPQERSSSARRSQHKLSSGLPTAPKAGGFEDIETEERVDQPIASRSLNTWAEVNTSSETLAIGSDDARYAVEGLLRSIAESLIDRGCRDLQLSVGVANIANVEAAVEHIEAEIYELERRSDAIEQRGREHESSLRFAIGELRFEIDQAQARKESIDLDIRDQLKQLERRLAELAGEVDRDLAAITDREIALTAEKATKEEELNTLYDTLARLIDEIGPRFQENPEVRSLLDRLHRARAMRDFALHEDPTVEF